MDSENPLLVSPSKKPKFDLPELKKDGTFFSPKRYPLQGYINNIMLKLDNINEDD